IDGIDIAVVPPRGLAVGQASTCRRLCRASWKLAPRQNGGEVRHANNRTRIQPPVPVRRRGAVRFVNAKSLLPAAAVAATRGKAEIHKVEVGHAFSPQ